MEVNGGKFWEKEGKVTENVEAGRRCVRRIAGEVGTVGKEGSCEDRIEFGWIAVEYSTIEENAIGTW